MERMWYDFRAMNFMMVYPKELCVNVRMIIFYRPAGHKAHHGHGHHIEGMR